MHSRSIAKQGTALDYLKTAGHHRMTVGQLTEIVTWSTRHMVNSSQIEVYKILNGKYDEEATSLLRSRYCKSHYHLRDHQFSIYQSQVHCDIRKCNFANRVLSLWNSLPEAVVCADTVDTFKNRLDNF